MKNEIVNLLLFARALVEVSVFTGFAAFVLIAAGYQAAVWLGRGKAE